MNHCIIGKLSLYIEVVGAASGSRKAPAKKVPTKKALQEYWSKNKSSKKQSISKYWSFLQGPAHHMFIDTMGLYDLLIIIQHSKYSFTRYHALNTGEVIDFFFTCCTISNKHAYYNRSDKISLLPLPKMPVNKRKRAPAVLVHDSDKDVPLSPLSFLAKLGRTNSGPANNTFIPSVPLTRARFNRAKKVVAGRDIFMDVDSLTAITKGKGKDKDLMAAFIDDEADEGENGSSDEVDHEEYEEDEEQEEDEELKAEDNDLGPDEDFVDVEEDDGGIADILVIPTSIGSDVVSLKDPVVVVGVIGADPENMSSVISSHGMENPSRKKISTSQGIKREGISASGVCDEVIVYHEDLIPSKTDYTNVDVILSAVESALVLWGEKSLQVCGVCENVDHPGVDHELKNMQENAINLPYIEYNITGDVDSFGLIECIWNKIIKCNVIGNNILSLSQNPPTLFEWVASKNGKSKCKLHLCFRGTDALVGGFMFGQVPKTRSSISIVVIETEWEHVTSMLSMVGGDIKLLSKIEGLSSPKKGVTLNRHVVQLGKTSGWKESYFANEHIPIYSAPHGGKIYWKKMTSLPQVTDDPVLPTPVCVIFTTSLYDSSGSSAADTVAFNVQCVIVLE
ncbi:hypothetical protein K439DRAFT_1615797 [Ramaria rubella]|nr:hypothetical protein K439DRAFT_1615797 [Ramaria rubella]